MSAPAAPHIYVKSDGTRVYLRWLPCDTAESYTVCMNEGGSVAKANVEDSVLAVEEEPDGWFLWVSDPYCGVFALAVYATNADGDSALSGRVQVNLRGPAALIPDTSALEHHKR